MTDRKTPSESFGVDDGSAIRRALDVPEVIDQRYRVLGRLGAGAMGVVLKGEDLFLQRPVAIKVVEPGPLTVERFLKEAQALAQVRHENIVQVYACGPLQTSYYLAMELVIGESLETAIDTHATRGEVLPLPRARRILRAIGLGLEAVHAQKLVHRDIKPGNIMLEQTTDRPVLIDFGLARKRSTSSPRLSVTGGTPSYMAPEQARDPNGTRITARTDLYAFACTAFELFTGRPVFEGEDIYTMLLAHFNDPPRRISTLRPELAGIDDVVLKALSKNPEHRHTSITEFLDALDAGFERVGPPSVPQPRSRGSNPAAETQPSMVPLAELGPCALVLATDPGLRRSIHRGATQHLKGRSLDIAIETVASAAEAVTFLAASDCRIAIFDEESANGRLGELVAKARHRKAEVVILSRDFQATAATLGEHKVQLLVPKPVNVHVLSAVLGRVELSV